MFFYKLGFIPTSFVVIGCGGTGGRLLPLLAQYIRTINWISNPRIFAIDHDVVEEKNLIRQNFIRPDVNRPKAIVLAERYSKAFDVTVIPVVKRVELHDMVLSEVTHADQGVIKTTLENLNNAFVMLCVDSAQARRDIITSILSRNGNKNLLFIDAGNEDDYGQIQVFNPEACLVSWLREDAKKLAIPGLGIPFDVQLPAIPMPLAFYEGMKDTGTRNCAELDQTLAINALMATSMMGIIQNLIYQKPISYSRLDISLKAGSIPAMMNCEYLWDAAQPGHNYVIRNIQMPHHNFDVNKIYQTVVDRLWKDCKYDWAAEVKGKPSKKKSAKKLDEKAIEEI